MEFFDVAIIVTLNSSGTSNSKALGTERDASGGRCNSWAWWRLSTNHNQKVDKCFRSWSDMQLVPVEEIGEDEYNGTENSELDDEVRERIGRIKGFNEALDDLKHHVEKTLVGPKQTTRGGGNQDSLP